MDAGHYRASSPPSSSNNYELADYCNYENGGAHNNSQLYSSQNSQQQNGSVRNVQSSQQNRLLPKGGKNRVMSIKGSMHILMLIVCVPFFGRMQTFCPPCCAWSRNWIMEAWKWLTPRSTVEWRRWRNKWLMLLWHHHIPPSPTAYIVQSHSIVIDLYCFSLLITRTGSLHFVKLNPFPICSRTCLSYQIIFILLFPLIDLTFRLHSFSLLFFVIFCN